MHFSSFDAFRSNKISQQPSNTNAFSGAHGLYKFRKDGNRQDSSIANQTKF
jgi:hypothetical protein